MDRKDENPENRSSVDYQIAVNSIISSATDDRERINQSTSFSESLNRGLIKLWYEKFYLFWKSGTSKLFYIDMPSLFSFLLSLSLSREKLFVYYWKRIFTIVDIRGKFIRLFESGDVLLVNVKSIRLNKFIAR